MRTTAVLLGFLKLDTGNEDNSSFARFFKLDNMPSDSDKFKIIITLRRAQKSGDTGP